MPNYEYPRRNRHFTESGPDTTNVLWGIERILGLYGLASDGSNSRDAMIALEQYVRNVAGLVTSQVLIEVAPEVHGTGVQPTSLDIERIVEMAALEANIEFPEEVFK